MNYFARGAIDGGVGAVGFLTLTESLQLTDAMIQFILSICIIVVQALLIPLFKLLVVKIKTRVSSSKLHEETKDKVNDLIDDVEDKIIDKVNDTIEEVKKNKED